MFGADKRAGLTQMWGGEEERGLVEGLLGQRVGDWIQRLRLDVIQV